MSTIAVALSMNPADENGGNVVQTPESKRHGQGEQEENAPMPTAKVPPNTSTTTPTEREQLSSTETPIISTEDWENPSLEANRHGRIARNPNRFSFLREENALGPASTHTMSSSTSLPYESAHSNFESSNFSSSLFAEIQTTSSKTEEEQELLTREANAIALNFAMEHRIFLQAVLDLLNERDRIAPEVGMNDPIVLKSGPLKKASHLMNGVWKVKYVEIRRGMFSSYENASKDAEGELRRKNIPLQANCCRCRAVKLHQKALKFTPGGAIFELSVNGSRRLWMANSREERQAWILAIHNAMVGGSVTRSDSSNSDHRGSLRGVSPRSPFKDDLRQYLRTQACLRNAKTKQEYVGGLSELVDNSLKVPVKWIAKQGVLAATASTDNAFHEEAVHLSIEQLWRDLQRDSVSVNGELFQGDCGHGPEKIMGALMRQILGTGQSGDVGRCDLSESQALTYARDILLSGNRTRSGGDSYFCVNTLCRNDDLVVVVPSGAQAEPVSIIVTQDDSGPRSSSMYMKNEKSGWIKTRNKLQRKWRKLFFVLSEGTLSYYESALPRPHRLRGQFVMNDASISIERKQPKPDGKPSNQYVLSVMTKDMKERLLLFESEDRLLDWTYALESTAKAKAGSESIRKSYRRRSSFDTKTPQVDGTGLAEQATKDHVVRLGLDVDVIEERLAMYARKTTSAVVVTIQASTAYNVCTVDPQGDERQDKWATIHAQFLQSFRLVGGPNGRIMRGEEVVRVTISECIDLVEESQEPPADPGTPTRRRKASRIFRSRNASSEEFDLGKSSDP